METPLTPVEMIRCVVFVSDLDGKSLFSLRKAEISLEYFYLYNPNCEKFEYISSELYHERKNTEDNLSLRVILLSTM